MGTKTMGSQWGAPGQTSFREGSLYSLTLDEVENQLGNLEKPLSGMNLDELLKTVLAAEASQLASSSSVPNPVVSRELSNKTVDEVWKSIQHEHNKYKHTGKDRGKQTTLGEMTLEEFLLKAGIVSGQAKDSSDNLFGDEEHGELGQQSHWMQYQLSPVEQTPACLMASNRQLHQPTHTGLSRLIGAEFPDTQLTVSVSPPRGMVSDAQTLGRKRVAPGEVVEKTVERRHTRMIKNRESAARSRARRQAYTNELENKISYLEEEIERLKKQQAVEKEVQCVPPPEPKPQLRRTNSGPL